MPFPSPTLPSESRAQLFQSYLDYFRREVTTKIQALPVADLRVSRLPSGWAPIELLNHLRYVELRWLVWGFEGQDVRAPWGDRADERWHVAEDETLASVLTAFEAQAARSNEIIQTHGLEEVGRPGPRWERAEPATLERILFHLLQEYARHAGHLDVVVELAIGLVGE